MRRTIVLTLALALLSALPASAGETPVDSHPEDITAADIGPIMSAACGDRECKMSPDLLAQMGYEDNLQGFFRDLAEDTPAFPGAATMYAAIASSLYVDSDGNRVFPATAAALPVIMKLARNAARGNERAQNALVRFTKGVMTLDVGSTPTPPGDPVGFTGPTPESQCVSDIGARHSLEFTEALGWSLTNQPRPNESRLNLLLQFQAHLNGDIFGDTYNDQVADYRAELASAIQMTLDEAQTECAQVWAQGGVDLEGELPPGFSVAVNEMSLQAEDPLLLFPETAGAAYGTPVNLDGSIEFTLSGPLENCDPGLTLELSAPLSGTFVPEVSGDGTIVPSGDSFWALPESFLDDLGNAIAAAFGAGEGGLTIEDCTPGEVGLGPGTWAFSSIGSDRVEGSILIVEGDVEIELPFVLDVVLSAADLAPNA